MGDPETKPGPTPQEDQGRRLKGTDAWAMALGVFLVALLMRILFAGAGPDAPWPHALAYKGDAYVWLNQVLASRTGQLFEAGLPLRPPGVPWLVDALWDGTEAGIEDLKSWWRVMGAATCALVFLALQRSFSVGVAAGTALLLAVSQGAMILSHSVNSEAPYLFLAAASFAVMPMREESGFGRYIIFGAVSAAACLVRTEHALFVLAMLAWWTLPAAGLAPGLRVRSAGVALAAVAFVSALIPAHLALWEKIERFNSGAYPVHAATEQAFQRIERRTARLAWDDDALEAVAAFPGFLRRSAGLFVAATAVQRKDGKVEREDVSVLREAFGAEPEPIAAYPFISSYGPLNFYLAHHPESGPGFGIDGLREPPPLAGGADRYPPDLIQGLPPARLSLEYLPHLRAFNHGYAMGMGAITNDPAQFLSRAAAKLGVLWGGTALGFGGYGLPLGAEGVRRPVDLATPDHQWATAWRLLFGTAALAGLILTFRRRDRRAALTPWLLYGASKFAVAILFYGYARQGVILQPVAYLGLALAVERWLAPRLSAKCPVRPAWCFLACLGIVVAVEGGRRAKGTGASVVAESAAPVERLAPDDHTEVRIRYSK